MKIKRKNEVEIMNKKGKEIEKGQKKGKSVWQV